MTLMQSLKKALAPGCDKPAESNFDLDLSLDRHQHHEIDSHKNPIVILRMKQLQERIGIRRSAVYYKLDKNSPHHDPGFPCPVKISSRCIGWIESEINVWLESRIRATRVPAKSSEQ